MQYIEYNKENYLILNQIYDTLAELKPQGKKIILCKVSAHIEIKGNEGGDIVAKQAIDMLGMVTRLPYTDGYFAFRRARNSKWQRK